MQHADWPGTVSLIAILLFFGYIVYRIMNNLDKQ